MASDPKEPIDEIEDDEILEEGDAGRDDDEGRDEAEAGQESEDAEAEEGQVDEPRSRGEKRFQKLSNETRAANERAAALEREVQELKAFRLQREAQDRAPKEESPEQEAQRLALMTVDERVEYKLNKVQQRHQFEMGVMAFKNAEMADKAMFSNKLSSDPRLKKYEAEVEAVLADARRNNQNFTREQILAFVVGQKVLTGGAAREKAIKAGAARVKSQQARADSGRGDQAAPRRGTDSGNSLRSLEKRLEGIPL